MIATAPYLGEGERAPPHGLALGQGRGRSFAEILSDRAGAPSPGGARRFDELGMFGVHDGHPMNLAGAGAEGAAGERPTEQFQQHARRQPEAERNRAPSVPTRAVAEANVPFAPRVSPSLETRVPLPKAQPFALVERPVNEAAFAAAPVRCAVSQRPVQTAVSSRSTANVIVSGDAGAIAIIARGNVSDGETDAIRKRFEQVASEFGVRLGEFQLNGSSPSISPIAGGRHGRNAG